MTTSGRSVPARPPTPRRAPLRLWATARRNGVWIYAGGLVFLGFVVLPLFIEPTTTGTRIRMLAVCVLIAGCYLGVSVAQDLSLRGRWIYLAALTASIALLIPDVAWQATYFGTYLTIAIAALIPFRTARFVIAGVGLALLTAHLVRQDWLGVLLAVVAGGSGLAMSGAIETDKIRHRMRELERRNDVLSVAAERERIGRDLHDILGHSLTAVAVKCQLAERLVERDPAACRAELAEVERIARQALGDVRSTASGLREVSVATELSSARAVLQAAGVECEAPSAAPLLSDRHNQLFGFAIREAVTNVVRHADAGRCTIELSERSVSITDDGRGGTRYGNGLTGLAERAAGVGAALEVGPGAHGGGTVLTVRLSAGGGEER